MADGWACAPDFARNPRRSCRPDADSSCPPARHAAWPNRVHSRLGLVFRLGLLSTCPRGHAVALGYLEVARCFKTQTFTGLFHKRISARTAVSHHSSPCVRSTPTRSPHTPPPNQPASATGLTSSAPTTPIPTGLRPKAQGWPEARRPTLGTHSKMPPTLSGLRPQFPEQAPFDPTDPKPRRSCLSDPAPPKAEGLTEIRLHGCGHPAITTPMKPKA